MRFPITLFLNLGQALNLVHSCLHTLLWTNILRTKLRSRTRTESAFWGHHPITCPSIQWHLFENKNRICCTSRIHDVWRQGRVDPTNMTSCVRTFQTAWLRRSESRARNQDFMFKFNTVSSTKFYGAVLGACAYGQGHLELSDVTCRYQVHLCWEMTPSDGVQVSSSSKLCVEKTYGHCGKANVVHSFIHVYIYTCTPYTWIICWPRGYMCMYRTCQCARRCTQVRIISLANVHVHVYGPEWMTTKVNKCVC